MDGHGLAFCDHDDLLLVGEAIVDELVIEEVAVVDVGWVPGIDDVGDRHKNGILVLLD